MNILLFAILFVLTSNFFVDAAPLTQNELKELLKIQETCPDDKKKQLTKICTFFNCPDDEAEWGDLLWNARISTHPDKYKDQEMKDLATKAFQLVNGLYNLHSSKRENLSDRKKSYQSSFERNVSGLNKNGSARSNQSTHGLYRNDSTRSSTSTHGFYRNDSTRSSTSTYGLDRSGSTRSSKSSDNVRLNRSRSTAAVPSTPHMNDICNDRSGSNVVNTNEIENIILLQHALLSDEKYIQKLNKIQSFIESNYKENDKIMMMKKFKFVKQEIIFAKKVFMKQEYDEAFKTIQNLAKHRNFEKLNAEIQELQKAINDDIYKKEPNIKLKPKEIESITAHKVNPIRDMLNNCNQAEIAHNDKNVELEKQTRLESEIRQEKLSTKILHVFKKSRKEGDLKMVKEEVKRLKLKEQELINAILYAAISWKNASDLPYTKDLFTELKAFAMQKYQSSAQFKQSSSSARFSRNNF